MAALLIVGALAIADKVEQKKEKKRQKKANDEKRYRELQLETDQRLARRDSVTAVSGARKHEGDFAEEEDEGEEGSDSDGVKRERDEGWAEEDGGRAKEDAVSAGERREREWMRRMKRRRSSANSGGKGEKETSGAGTGAVMRMR